jgi:hypothetical protein
VIEQLDVGMLAPEAAVKNQMPFVRLVGVDKTRRLLARCILPPQMAQGCENVALI